MAKRSKLNTSSARLSLVAEPSIQSSPDSYPRVVGELWTAKQRQLHSMHYSISYRGSFKPELPDFLIKRYSNKGDIVFDPFSGRGTTALQANLLGRVAWASDVNPLSILITEAKLNPVGLDEVVLRLNQIDFRRPIDLHGYSDLFSPFYHPDTFRELVNLKNHVKENPDTVSRFIEMIAISRLHGHSPGFFSVYSFPQISVPPESQRSINEKRGQVPEYRSVAPRVIKKAAQCLRDGFTSDFFEISSANRINCSDSRSLGGMPSDSVNLVVTSPPFLDKVDYLSDNWLEFWFAGISPKSFKKDVIMSSSLEDWKDFIRSTLKELLRVTKKRGVCVMEVGEVEHEGEILNLDEEVAKLAREVSVPGKCFVVEELLINKQKFTKMANCFKVSNNEKGTNTNRMVVLRAVASRRR